ncbi:MAG: DUF1993 domain-containing protein [Bdellovibrionia bacterium]
MLFDIINTQFIKSLEQLSAILDKGAKHAETKKFEMDVLFQSRLAPDQFPLMRQIQIACDTAKLAHSRLCAKEAPAHPDTEKTLAEVKARIASVVSYLKTYKAQDFEGAEQRRITNTRWEGKTMSGYEFAVQHAIPNLFFHLTTAYSILRHNGVEIGKKDYLGPMPLK